MDRRFFSLFIIFLCLFFAANKSVAVETISDEHNNLLGAIGVKINNQLYDVKFEDKPAEILFLNKENNYNFLFTTLEDAKAASQALLDQVLVDQYDTHPEYTHGIDYKSCSYILTPYKAEFSEYYNHILIYIYSAVNSYAQNSPGDHTIQYSAQLESWSPTTLTDADDSLVYAVWTLNTATAVPEPATALLFSVGILGITSFGRKRRTVKANI